MKKIGILVVTLVFAFTGLIVPIDAEEEVKLAYGEWTTEIASVHVVKAVLQEKMGYTVKIIPVSVATTWQSVASGDVDGMVAAWLPKQDHYLEQMKDAVDNLGPNLQGTRIGLVVPAYVEIDSIGELNDAADKFDGLIIGIELDTEMMTNTEKMLEVYGLDNFELMEGSEDIMTTVLQKKIEDQVWVVVTGWTPHWKFVKWDLKYLKDPEGIYGGEGYIGTIVRKRLKEDMPEVYTFLDNFHWTPDDMEEVMFWNLEGADPYESAKRWIKEHPEKVAEWLQ